MRAGMLALVLLIGGASAATVTVPEPPAGALEPGGAIASFIVRVEMPCDEHLRRLPSEPGTTTVQATVSVTSSEPTLTIAGTPGILLPACAPGSLSTAGTAGWSVAASVDTPGRTPLPLDVSVALSTSPSPLDANEATTSFAIEAQPKLTIIARSVQQAIVMEEPGTAQLHFVVQALGNVPSTVQLASVDFRGGDAAWVGDMEPISFADPPATGAEASAVVAVDLSQVPSPWEGVLTLTLTGSDAEGEATATDEVQWLLRRPGTNLGDRLGRETTPGPGPALLVAGLLASALVRRP